jgi:NADPH:quinone reductase-like Zn-dependent oxidoreductase
MKAIVYRQYGSPDVLHVGEVDRSIKEDMLRHIGADNFIDYTREVITKSGQAYDVIIDMVANSSCSGCIKSLKHRGCYQKCNPRLSDMIRTTLTTKLTNRAVTFTFAGETREELLTLKQMIEDGSIRPVIDKIYSP